MSEKHKHLKIYTKSCGTDLRHHMDEYDLPSSCASEKTTWAINGLFGRRNGNYDFLLDDGGDEINIKIWKKGSTDSLDYWFYHSVHDEYSIFYNRMQPPYISTLYQEFILIIIQI